MVTMPNLRSSRRKTEEQQMKFVGMDYRAQAADGSFSDCDGISPRGYPSIQPREKLEEIGQYDQISCMKGFGEDLLVCAGTNVYWNGDKVGRLTLENVDGGIDVNTARQAAMVNTQVCIFPDKLIFDTSSGELASIDGIYDVGGFVTYRQYVISEMQYYHILDFSQGDDEDADRSDAEELLSRVRVGDTVFLTGFDGVGASWAANDKTGGITVRYVDADGYRIGFYDNSFAVLDEASDANGARSYADGMKYVPHGETLRIEYRCPELELVAEADNRLWGVEGNTIYACALGEPRNWYRYDGLADDAYALGVAGSGDFTAICGYSTHVCFFKEDRIHRIYGSKPSNYSMTTLACPGVQRGGQDTVQVISGVLWYVGAGGVYAYDGDVPECVSAQLGTRPYQAMFAAAVQEGYYVYMDCGRGMQLYCLDTGNAVWTVWDKAWYAAGTVYEGKLCLATPGGAVMQAGSEMTDEEWFFTLGEFTEGVAGRKTYSKLVIQCDMSREAYVGVQVQFDGGRWIRVLAAEGKYGTRVMYVPLPPNRCYSMAVRIGGRGEVKIRGIARAYSLCSDVR